jgi:hypothetical protein
LTFLRINELGKEEVGTLDRRAVGKGPNRKGSKWLVETGDDRGGDGEGFKLHFF